MKWNTLATKEQVEKTITALKANGIDAVFVKNGIEAKKKALEIMPNDSEVMNMSSVTLDTIGLPDEINKSGKFNSVRNKLVDKKVSDIEKKQLGVAPEWAV